MIDVALVRDLVATQFPQWKELDVRPVAVSGWDNRTFHLGQHMLVRMPSADKYANQVEKEHVWLPRLAPALPAAIPEPVAMGEPAVGYPWHWGIYRWIDGETAASGYIGNKCEFALSVAHFLIRLQQIDPKGGPLPGVQNFHRGGPLTKYSPITRNWPEAPP